MKQTLLHLAVILGGVLLIWIAAWNMKMDDKTGEEKTSSRYVMQMIIGFFTVLMGLLFMLRDFVNLF